MRYPNLMASLRDRKGLSISGLAAELCLDSNLYIEVELGKSRPDEDLSHKLEDFFGYPIDDLLLPTTPRRTLWQLMDQN